jgi:PKD repeat protein
MINTSFFNLRQGPEKRFIVTVALLLLIVSLPVWANKAPQAVFTVEPTSGPAPLNIQLDASASSDSDGGIVSYQWFVGGQTTAGQKASLTLNKVGYYELVLIIVDDLGAFDMGHQTIEVSDAPPSAQFSVTPESGTQPLLVTLDASASKGNLIAYDWLITQKESSSLEKAYGQKVSWLFQEAGSYDISLTVSGHDGQTASLTHPKPIVIKASPNQKPIADFSLTIEPEEGTGPFSVQLDASPSVDPDGRIIEYEWETSDGQSNFGKQTNFVLKSASEITITLTVTDNAGETDSITETATLGPPTPPAPEYNTTARVNPQIIAGGISPSQVDMSDDRFNIVALVRPGSSPTRTVTFQDRTGEMRLPLMTLVGVLSNGDEFYQATLSFSPGTYTTTLKTAWGPKDGQFNIVATDESNIPSQTYPYLKIGTYPAISENKRQSVTPLSYNTTKHYDPQVIMAGFSPAIIDKTDTQFDVIAIVRPGALAIDRVIMRHPGLFEYGMQLAGELGNGDQMYKFTYVFEQGALGNPERAFVELKELWGTPGLEGLGIEVIDDGGMPSHQFPDVEFGYYPEYRTAD